MSDNINANVIHLGLLRSKNGCFVVYWRQHRFITGVSMRRDGGVTLPYSWDRQDIAEGVLRHRISGSRPA